MINQLFLGSVVTLVSLIGGASLWWLLNEAFERMERWVLRPPQPLKLFVTTSIAVVATMAIMTFGVWLWAATFMFLSVFGSLEEAIYFSLVAYTTLGLGDVFVPQEHRLLGGMTGANGFLMFGLMTAMLTDTLRNVRRLHRGPKAGTR